jgi:hypothetical protein
VIALSPFLSGWSSFLRVRLASRLEALLPHAHASPQVMFAQVDLLDEVALATVWLLVPPEDGWVRPVPAVAVVWLLNCREQLGHGGSGVMGGGGASFT